MSVPFWKLDGLLGLTQAAGVLKMSAGLHSSRFFQIPYSLQKLAAAPRYPTEVIVR